MNRAEEERIHGFHPWTALRAGLGLGAAWSLAQIAVLDLDGLIDWHSAAYETAGNALLWSAVSLLLWLSLRRRPAGPRVHGILLVVFFVTAYAAQLYIFYFARGIYLLSRDGLLLVGAMGACLLAPCFLALRRARGETPGETVSPWVAVLASVLLAGIFRLQGEIEVWKQGRAVQFLAALVPALRSLEAARFTTRPP